MATTSAKKSTGGGKKPSPAKNVKEKASTNGTKPTDSNRFDLHKSLQEYFGFDKFKDNQEKIIDEYETLMLGLCGQPKLVIQSPVAKAV